jgi:hypothetical protein
MEEIEEIRQQFDKAERETDPIFKLQLIKAGIELVEDFKESYSEEKNAQIENILITYARCFLEQILKIKEIEHLPWMDYIFLFLTDFNQQVQIVIESNAVLKKDFEDFISLWGDKKAFIAALNSEKKPPQN